MHPARSHVLLSLFAMGLTALPAGEAQSASPAAKGEPTSALIAAEVGSPATGLIVQIGGGDRLPDALRSGSTLGLAVVANDAAARALRTTWAGSGLLGQAEAVVIAGTVLPLRDDTARVLIADLDALPLVTETELIRVLRPQGAGWVRQGGTWKRLSKPRPAEVDDWAQYNHDAAASEVSKDLRVGPARSLQWISGPQGTTSHGLLIIDGLRLGIELSEVNEKSPENQDGGALVARDAYTGLVRWRREDAVPGSRYAWVAGHGRVYFYPATPQYGLPARCMRMLDLQTGEDAGWLDQGIGIPVPDQMPKDKPGQEQLKTLSAPMQDATARLTDDGLLVQVMGPRVVVLDAKTGARRWEKRIEVGVYRFPVVLGDALYLAQGAVAGSMSYTHWPAVSLKEIVCLAMQDGSERWRTAWDANGASGEVVVYNLAGGDGHLAGSGRFGPGAAAGRGRHGLLLFNAATGKLVHGGPTAITSGRDGAGDEIGGGHSSARSFIFNDRVWTHTIVGLNGSLPLAAPADPAAADQRYRGLLRPVGCTAFRASPNWIFGSLTTYAMSGEPKVFQTDALRTACDVGAFPALGLTFIASNHCFCTPYLPGSAAFSSRPFVGIDDTERLSSGPGRPAPATADPGGWATFLRDPRRSAWCPDPISATLAEVWRIKPDLSLPAEPLLARSWQDSWYVQGPLSQPVFAEGVVVVARCHQHQVLACDPESGKERWRVELDGRIAGAPTIHQGLVLVGTCSGTVYALNRDDGQVVWRFRAAPRADRIVVDGQLESPWPCFGPVVADPKGLLVVAGRHTDSDGGLWWWRLDPVTGKPLGQGRFGEDELKRTTPGSGRTKAETSDPWVPNVSNNIPVVTEAQFLLPGLWAGRDANGDLSPPPPTPRPLKYGQPGFTQQEDPERAGWRKRYEAGVVVPGNQGLLHRPRFMFGYKLSGFSYSSGRFYAYDTSGDYVVVGGSVGFAHRGGSEGNPVRACRRLDQIERQEFADPKDPSKKQSALVGSKILWERSDRDLWFKDGIRAVAVADATVVIGFAVTNRDLHKEKARMPFRLRLLARSDGQTIGNDLALPAPPVSGGIAIAHGRILVSCEDGSLLCFAPPQVK